MRTDHSNRHVEIPGSQTQARSDAGWPSRTSANLGTEAPQREHLAICSFDGRTHSDRVAVRVPGPTPAKEESPHNPRYPTAFWSVSRKRSARRGVAVVEFALIAPFFVLVVLGIIEFGRMLMVQEIIINAAREGARTATLPGKTDALVNQTVDEYMSTSKITGYTRTISPSLASSPAAGAPLSVTVSVPCATVSWLGSPTWFANKSLSASVVMMKQ